MVNNWRLEMTKICPNCKTGNQNSSEFCQNCGNKLNNKPIKSSNGGFMGWWEKKSNGKKVRSIIGVCFLGLLIIVGINGMISPNKTVNNVTNGSTTASSGTFSNEYVSFALPSGYVAVSQADNGNGFCDVWIFSGKPSDNISNPDFNLVGSIGTHSATKACPNIADTSSQIVNELRYGATVTDVTVNGISGYQFVNTDPNSGGYSLYTPSNGLILEMDPTQSSAFNTIKNSLVFK
jgi:hypothetical protein